MCRGYTDSADREEGIYHLKFGNSYPFKRKFGPIRSSRLAFCDDLKLLRRLIQDSGFYKLQITFNHPVAL